MDGARVGVLGAGKGAGRGDGIIGMFVNGKSNFDPGNGCSIGRIKSGAFFHF